MNQFIQDDEEEALNFNIRIAVEELLQTLLEIYPIETTQAICHAAQEHFQQSTQLMTSGDKHWWKIDEATLLALGRIKSELVSNLDKVQFDLSAVFDHVVQRAVSCQGMTLSFFFNWYLRLVNRFPILAGSRPLVRESIRLDSPSSSNQRVPLSFQLCSPKPKHRNSRICLCLENNSLLLCFFTKGSLGPIPGWALGEYGQMDGCSSR